MTASPPTEAVSDSTLAEYAEWAETRAEQETIPVMVNFHKTLAAALRELQNLRSCAPEPREQYERLGWVPKHPKNGPLWSHFVKNEADNTLLHYELMPVYCPSLTKEGGL